MGSEFGNDVGDGFGNVFNIALGALGNVVGCVGKASGKVVPGLLRRLLLFCPAPPAFALGVRNLLINGGGSETRRV